MFDLIDPPTLFPRFNVAPTQDVPVVRLKPETNQRELVMLKWGLIPSWAKEAAIGNRMINARADTLTQKPAFQSAFRERRCLMHRADGDILKFRSFLVRRRRGHSWIRSNN
jgi:putative SOS response-associated peptidase YedK